MFKREKNEPKKGGESDETAGDGGKSQAMLIYDEEMEVRKSVANGLSGNIFSAYVINGFSAVLVFVKHLISLESLVSIALCVSLTIYTYNETKDNASFDGGVMDWVLLSFAVITPLSASIGMAFKRRERALLALAEMKATLFYLYSVHVCWDWAKPGKEPSGRAICDIDWVVHSDGVLVNILTLCTELSRLLTLPNSSRARHRVTPCGKSEAHRIDAVMRKLHKSMLSRINVITMACEVLKKEGLPPNEATRVRQWERRVTEVIEILMVIKRYRTPQALRSFARLFTVFLPPYYAPYYAQMAISMNSLPMGITFSVLTSIALGSLFESISQIEDPFIGILALDGIDVWLELGDEFHDTLFESRKFHFPDAPNFDQSAIETPNVPTSTEIRLLQAL